MPKVLDNIRDLEGFLDNIVREAVVEAMDDTGTLERQRQKRLAAQTSEQDGESGKQHVEEAEEETEETEETEEVELAADVEKPSDTKVAAATTGDIFKTLNIMRSGRSLKDPKVKKALITYIEQLTPGEQQSLYAFLSGLAEMMVAGESGQAATDPGQAGIRVKATEKGEAGTEEIDVGVKTVKIADKKEKEDMPIVVGESADKSKIRKRIRELWKS